MRQMRSVCSQAMSVEPLPPNRSMTTPLGAELFLIGYASSGMGFTPFDVHGKRPTGNICLRAVRMTGRIEITDAARFAEAYQSGIGPEKAYGMGMLLLGG